MNSNLRIQKLSFVFVALSFIFVAIGVLPTRVDAEISKGTSLSSDSFRILDSQQTTFGGIASSSSSSFILTSTIGGFAIGSASATSFGFRSGFLYFPKVSAPTLNTATAGDAQVALSWSAATAFQGWSIGGYNRCFKTTGSYTCEDVGNVTSSTKTGLTNETTYTFKIEAYDGLAAKNVIATSNEKTAAPAAAATPTPTPAPSGGGGGGGGGGGFVTPPSGTGTIIIKGTAYPESTVSIYQDGNLITSIKAGASAKFETTISSVLTGSRVIGINSKDANGRVSLTVSFNVSVTANSTTTLSDIILPPTIDLSNYRPAKGETLNIFGQAAPSSEVNVHVASEETVSKVVTDSNGAYSIKFDTKPLTEDEHTAKSRAILDEVVSPFSKVLQFFVGKGGPLKTADLNKDGRVNIIDFSIMLFWWNTSQQRGLDIADINGDKKVNIVDFSIMLFQWSG